MKIAIVVNELNIRGGTHKQILRLCEYLVAQKNDVTIYTKYLDLDKTYPEFSNFSIVCVPPKNEIDKNRKNGIFKKIKNKFSIISDNLSLLKKIPKDVDIINVHDQAVTPVVYYAKKYCKNAKVVWQINDLPNCFFVGVSQDTNSGRNKIMRRLERHFIRKAAKKCDRITVNVSKNKLRVEENLKCPAEVFYCGVDVNDNLEMHIYPTDAKPLKLLSTGVFFPYRNYESLVLAVDKLSKEGIDVRLDIIGSTKRSEKYAEFVMNLITEKNLLDKVTVWGQVDEDKYNELYNEANIFMFLNIDQSWGLAVFEAMSCGIPVLVSNSVGAIELLHHGEDSLIIEPKDIEEICNSILKLKDNKDVYEAISKNAAEAVKNFTWDRLYNEKVYELFQKLTNKC